jgi:hypothetical protein
LQARAGLEDDAVKKTEIMAESKVVQNNARPQHIPQVLDYQERKRLRDLDLADISIPPYFTSISFKAPYVKTVIDPNILPASIVPTSPVLTLIILDREVLAGYRYTVDATTMREISFLNYDTKEKFSIVLEKYGSQVPKIDEDRLCGMALKILNWIPDESGVYLGYWQMINQDMDRKSL